MSDNLPPGVTDADIDRSMGGDVAPEQQAWLDDVANARESVKGAVRAVVDSLIKYRHTVTEHDLACVLETVAEAISHNTAYAAERLEEAGFEGNYSAWPDEHEKFIAEEHERLLDAFRVKPLDAAGLLRDAVRPAATNPATLISKGVDQ